MNADNNKDRNNDTFSALRSHLEEAIEEQRAKVEKEAERLRRLEEMRGLALSSGGMPAAPKVPTRFTSSPPPPAATDLGAANIPALITLTLREAPGHTLTAGEIVERVQAMKPQIEKTSIYPAVYRMAKNGRLKEDRGNDPFRYTLVTPRG